MDTSPCLGNHPVWFQVIITSIENVFFLCLSAYEIINLLKKIVTRVSFLFYFAIYEVTRYLIHFLMLIEHSRSLSYLNNNLIE